MAGPERRFDLPVRSIECESEPTQIQSLCVRKTGPKSVTRTAMWDDKDEYRESPKISYLASAKNFLTSRSALI
jgi:hypothetical protein